MLQLWNHCRVNIMVMTLQVQSASWCPTFNVIIIIICLEEQVEDLIIIKDETVDC